LGRLPRRRRQRARRDPRAGGSRRARRRAGRSRSIARRLPRLPAVIDLRAARSDPAAFRAALARKGATELFDELLAADEAVRAVQQPVEELRSQRKPKGKPSPEEIERAAKVSGSRFAYRIGDVALLELALYRYALDRLVQQGFVPVLPPVLVREDAMYGTGFLPTEEVNLYKVERDELYLTGTAEV